MDINRVIDIVHVIDAVNPDYTITMKTLALDSTYSEIVVKLNPHHVAVAVSASLFGDMNFEEVSNVVRTIVRDSKHEIALALLLQIFKDGPDTTVALLHTVADLIATERNSGAEELGAPSSL